MLRKLLPHVTIIISMMYFLFFFIDRVNSAMAFINNDITKVLLFVYCVIAIYESILLIRENRANERRNQMRRQQALDAQRREARSANVPTQNRLRPVERPQSRSEST